MIESGNSTSRRRDSKTSDTNGGTRVETTRREQDNRRNLRDSRDVFFFFHVEERVHALSATVPFTVYIMGREEYPFTCAINLSPREADLIRIRKPDTYLNARLH